MTNNWILNTQTENIHPANVQSKDRLEVLCMNGDYGFSVLQILTPTIGTLLV